MERISTSVPVQAIGVRSNRESLQGKDFGKTLRGSTELAVM
jgi:hypothetical protein